MPGAPNVNVKPFRRALAVRGGALGDFILTLPSLKALRDAGYEVELLTRPAYGRLAREAGQVSGWRSLESPDASALMVAGAEVTGEWKQWLSGFDVVVSWLPDDDQAFRQQILSCGAGTFYQGDWRCMGIGPAAYQLAEAVAFTGAEITGPADLFGGREDSKSEPVRRIAFHPGSGSMKKNWHLESWIKVMGFLSSKDPGIVWRIISGEVEEARLPELAALLNQAGVRWESVHALDLRSLCHRLRECGGLFGHDSGVSHLAAACGLPCRLLFGPTSPEVWAPLGPDVEVMISPDGDLNQLSVDAVIDWLCVKPLCLD